jgi:hypothetical protein
MEIDISFVLVVLELSTKCCMRYICCVHSHPCYLPMGKQGIKNDELYT